MDIFKYTIDRVIEISLEHPNIVFFFDTEYKGKKDHTYELLEKLAYSVYRDVKIDKIIDELINDL